MIIVIFLLWVAFNAYLVTKMSPKTAKENVFSDDHFITIALDHIFNSFKSTGADDARSIKITLFWGVDRLKYEHLSRYDWENKGEVVWDDTFRLGEDE